MFYIIFSQDPPGPSDPQIPHTSLAGALVVQPFLVERDHTSCLVVIIRQQLLRNYASFFGLYGWHTRFAKYLLSSMCFWRATTGTILGVAVIRTIVFWSLY